MTQLRYLVSFLLLAGLAAAHAQPIVKINPGSSECDVTPTTGEIFHLDTTGNVLITGTLSGACGSGGGTGGTTVTFNPLSAAALSATPSQINATVNTAVISYNAAYATGGCSVSSSAGTVTGSGTCPALNLNGTSCTEVGSNCSASGSAGVATDLPATATKCTYTLTATCNPGVITSTATLAVIPSGTVIPGSCPNLARIGTGASGYWSQVGNTTVKFGDGTVKSVDATSYVDVWSYPGNPTAWPGSVGLTTRPSASVNMYFAEKFTTPASLSSHPAWSFSGSGINSNMSMAISTCPGDFGQTGTQITPGCMVDMASSSSGLTAIVNATQIGGACTLKPNTNYYFNILPMASLPSGDVAVSGCSGTCTPWLGRN